ENKFDREGEGLFVAKVDNQIVGIIGLNIDPYLNDETIGRVRHLYVLPQYRNIGVGTALLKTIIQLSYNKFRILTLFTENPYAEQLYLKIGFTQSNDYNKATHILELKTLVNAK